MTGAPSMPQLVIVSPALRDANNGNWQTARRWQRHLAGVCRVRIVKAWPDALAAGDAAMIALHARRSAEAIAAWAGAHPGKGLAVVLTGTDLYRDIAADAAARHSLDLAQALVVLQERAPLALPDAVRAKARVIFQSTTARKVLAKSSHHLRAVMVGHLREEKSPQTLFTAARLLAGRDDLFIDHIGAALDPALGEAARATMAAAPNYRWLGGRPHEAVRRHIQRAHLLIHASCMEGGAHVVMEAVASGTPVLASRIDGNVGMLGADYAGYFPWGDAEALATLLLRCRESVAGEGGGLMAQLAAQCRQRAPLFAPERERAALHRLLGALLQAAGKA
ncbi:putative glycosyltransferase, TIGR04348 family [Thauera chlorobenzoica]|uniref:Glycosyl transferase, group 1 n=2 Tax=Thauera chlorobenzoica TaxID=96773 RepID=A0A1H5XG38_9RHOO|nr:Glycosyl transferase, group 1 [Thauera chlorobenzoica]SEG10593.1 putative glycosyltransferase, TIGR04348 family [Thauera chlorobenzoica]